jgi:hypothetical protein
VKRREERLPVLVSEGDRLLSVQIAQDPDRPLELLQSRGWLPHLRTPFSENGVDY